MSFPFPRVAIVAAALWSSGCAHVPRDAGRAEIASRVDATLGIPDTASRDDDAAWLDAALAAPLSREDAVRVALTRSPRVRLAYARLGFSRAEVIEAGRLSDPKLSLAFLRGGPVTQITRGIVVPFTELLMLPARSRLAAHEFDATRDEVASTLLALAGDTEAAWYRTIGARQVATMRDAAAEAATIAAALAQRHHDAGNLGALALQRQLAEASEARLDAERARRDARREELALSTLLGIADGRRLVLPDRLPLPPAHDEAVDDLVALQRDQRADLAAARARATALDDALRLARRWRFVGEVDVGYERERESDGERLRGPTIELAIPLFRHGRPAIERAQAALETARAQLDQDTLVAANDLRAAHGETDAARTVVDEYRRRLVPQREAVVARAQEHVNYMLLGTFELLAAKRDVYAAYQGYIEAVRDYWLARAELRRATGGSLPLDAEPAGDAIPWPDDAAPDAASDEPAHHHHPESSR